MTGAAKGPSITGVRRAGALLVVACCVVFLPAISASSWVHDDHPAVRNNANVKWPPPLRSILTTSYFGPGDAFAHMPLSRPLVTLTFCVEEGLGVPVRGRKSIQWLLYVATCLTLFGALCAVLSQLGYHGTAGIWGAAASSALFAVHPAHVGVAMSLAYRTEILALFWVLAGTWWWFRGGEGTAGKRTVGVTVALALGLLCKESAVCALAPWAVIAWSSRDRRLRAPLLGCVAVVIGFVVWRVAALGGMTVATIPPLDNPLAHVPADQRVISAFSLVSLAAEHLLFPWSLSPDYSFDALRLPSTWTTASVVGLVLSAAWLAGVALSWLRHRAIAVGLLWVGAFWAPASNLLFAIPVLFADRLLFAPSAAVCALAGCGAVLWADRYGRSLAVAAVPLAAVTVVAVSLTVGASFDWTDDHALYRRGVVAQPRSVKMRLNYGLNRLHAKQPSRAINHLQAALKLAPDDHDVRASLLTAYAQTKSCDGARGLVDETLATKVAPRTVRLGLLQWALACQEIKLANELAAGLGLRKRAQRGDGKSRKTAPGGTR